MIFDHLRFPSIYLTERPRSMSEFFPWREQLIDVLDLSVRSFNMLKRSNIGTLGQLYDLVADNQLKFIRNIGIQSQSEILEKLGAYLNYPQTYFSPIEPNYSGTNITSQIPVSVHATDTSGSTYELFGEKPLEEMAVQSKPAWHLYSVDSLTLSSRLCRILAREGYTTLGQLAVLIQNYHLSDIRGFGPKLFTELKDQLETYLTTLPESSFKLESVEVRETETFIPSLVKPADISSQERVITWLSSLTERQYQVLARRYGFHGEPLTLEAVSEEFKLTRERIRQIENKILGKLKRPQYEDLIAPLLVVVNSAFEQAEGILTDGEAAEIGRQLISEDVMNGLALIRLLSKTWGEFTGHKKEALWVWANKNSVRLDIQAQIVRVLRSTKAPMSEKELLDHLRRSEFYHLHKSELSASLLKVCLRTHPDLEHREDGLVGLATWAKHRIDDIIMALRRIGHPMHYSEITEMANKLLPPDMQTGPHNIHAQMQRYPDIFVRVGQGTYGLAEWGLEPAEFYPDIIERIFREVGHPLLLPEVLTKVCEVRDCKQSTVAMLLQFNDQFRSFPGGLYGLAEWDDDKFPDSSYREKRLIAAIVDSDTQRRKSKPEVTKALRDIDDLISRVRGKGSNIDQPTLF